MRLLLFSDLHADAAAARRLVELARTADVVVGAGDFANAHHGIGIALDVLRAIDRPAVLVPGNNETADELRAAVRGWPSAVVLHGDGTVVNGVPFFGLGGGVPVTPFGAWSYDFTESQATEMLAAAPAGCVLVSHSPPRGACDVASSGKSLGSTAVREVIDRLAPRLVVCGHIHACGGTTATVGRTPVVNAGPAGVWWTL